MYFNDFKVYCKRKHLGRKICMFPVTEVVDVFQIVCWYYRALLQHEKRQHSFDILKSFFRPTLIRV